MLVKRPILIGDDFVLVGFKETDYDSMYGSIIAGKGGFRKTKMPNSNK